MLAVALSTLQGCRSAPPREPTDEDMALFAAAHDGSDVTGRDHCGDDGSREQPPRVIVPINNEICLGCAGVGWMIREWNRSGQAPILTLVAERSQADEVCLFLKQQRAVAHVVALPMAELPPWWPTFRSLWLVEVLPGGAVGRVLGGVDGQDVLDEWIILGEDSHAALGHDPPPRKPQ